jgi:hypothetical protein
MDNDTSKVCIVMITIVSIIIISILILIMNIEGFSANYPNLRYGGADVKFYSINETMPIIKYSADGLLIPNSYSYYNKAPSIDGPDTKQPDNNPTGISDVQLAKHALI